MEIMFPCHVNEVVKNCILPNDKSMIIPFSQKSMIIRLKAFLMIQTP